MLKNKYFILIILFFLLLTYLLFIKHPVKQTTQKTLPNNKKIIQTSLLPSQTVINFYDKYLNFKGNLMSFESVSGSEYLTEDFKNKLKNEFSKKPIVSPVICLNNKPEQIIVHSATISANMAAVLVTMTSKNVSYDHLLKLKFSGNKYIISDIICK